MLGLAWSCDWQGCEARITVAYDSDWGRFQADNGWIDGSWFLDADSGWTTDENGKVWCPVHALIHEAEGATGLELRVREFDSAMKVLGVAEQHPGPTPLRITAEGNQLSGGLRPGGVTVGPELVAQLLEYGQLVVIGS